MEVSARSRISPLAALALAALGLGLAWMIVTRSLAAYLADAEPRWSLALWPGNSNALLRLADHQLGQDRDIKLDPADIAPVLNSAAARARVMDITARGVTAPMIQPDISEAERVSIRRLAAAAWMNSPLDPRAPRILGQVAPSPEKERELMSLAGAMSKHDPLSRYWLIQDAFLRSDIPAALEQANLMLLAQPDAGSLVTPILSRIGESKEGLAPLIDLLRLAPPWRREFFSILPGAAYRDTLPLEIMSGLKAKGVAATDEELGFYLSYLMQNETYDLARQAFSQIHAGGGDDAGGLYNGSFTAPPANMPFDWVFDFKGGVRVEVADAPAPPARRAVQIEFLEQTITSLAVRQTIVLPPGSYKLAGQMTGDFRARRGLRWRVSCLEALYTPYAQSDALQGGAGGWKHGTDSRLTVT